MQSQTFQMLETVRFSHTVSLRCQATVQFVHRVIAQLGDTDYNRRIVTHAHIHTLIQTTHARNRLVTYDVTIIFDVRTVAKCH